MPLLLEEKDRKVGVNDIMETKEIKTREITNNFFIWVLLLLFSLSNEIEIKKIY